MNNNLKTIKQVAKETGLTVRTLHYYDEINLLCPSVIAPNGYRMYDENSLKRLQQILFFKELDFPLKEINQLINNDGFDENEALEKHKRLLILKRNRLDNLINLVDDTLKGNDKMSFKEFDMSEIEKAQKEYQVEAKERWGNTEAYSQSAKRTKKYTKEDWQKIKEDSNEIFKDFAKAMHDSLEDEKVCQLVKRWQSHISKYYYECTDEILLGLGEMYVADERFKKNIDKFGDGLAQFMNNAIQFYCRK